MPSASAAAKSQRLLRPQRHRLLRSRRHRLLRPRRAIPAEAGHEELILEELGFGDCDCRFGKVMIGDVVGLRGGGEGKIEVGDDVAPLVWLGGVHVGVRFRYDPMGILGACTQLAAETAAAIVIVPPKC